jgi:hypothetical protein
VATLGIQVHFYLNSGPLQPGIVGEGLLYAVYLVVLVLEEKGWGRLLGKMALHILLESDTVLVNGKVTGVDRYSEVWPAAHVIRSVKAGVNTFLKMNARSCYKVTSRRETNYANSVWIDVPLGGMKPS